MSSRSPSTTATRSPNRSAAAAVSAGMVRWDRGRVAAVGHRTMASSTPISRARLPPMILRTVSSGAPCELLHVAGRIGEPLGVRVVGAEQHVVDADQVGEGDEVLLPERAHVDVPLHDLHRILQEVLRHLLVEVLEVLDERLHPAAAVLDHRHLELREARQRAVADRGRRPRPRSGATATACGTPAAGTGASRCRCPSSRSCSARSRCRSECIADEDVVLHDLLPEGVELGEAERARAAEAGDRRGADQHGAGAALDHPLELLDRLLHDGQRDHRRGEDAALVVELPGLVHPLVEGVDHGVDQLGIVPHALLHQAGQRGEHQGAVDALLVHELDAGRRLAEGRDGPHRLAEDLAAALALRVAVAEVVLLRAGPGHHVEGGVGDVVADRSRARRSSCARARRCSRWRPCSDRGGAW